MELSYSRGAEDFILDALALELDEAGHITYEDGGYVPTLCGKESERIDRVGAYAHSEEHPNDTAIVCDHMSCIVSWKSERREDWEDPRNQTDL